MQVDANANKQNNNNNSSTRAVFSKIIVLGINQSTRSYIYYRNLQFQGSSQQMVMCRLCGEHLFTSRERPNDPPPNIPEKNDGYSVQSGLYHVILKPLVCSF